METGNVRVATSTLNQKAIRVLVSALDRLGENPIQLFGITPAESEQIRTELMEKLVRNSGVKITYKLESRVGERY